MVKQLWVEKYRPEKVEEVLGQEQIVAEIRSLIESDNMQHFIFYSPEPGTGKTSMAHAIAKELDYQVHRFNASSKKQRGIEFAAQTVAIAPVSYAFRCATTRTMHAADRETLHSRCSARLPGALTCRRAPLSIMRALHGVDVTIHCDPPRGVCRQRWPAHHR